MARDDAEELTPQERWDRVMAQACDEARSGSATGVRVSRWNEVSTRVWFGLRRTRPSGGLYLAQVARPHVPMGFIGSVGTVAGLGAVEALRPFGVPARLAWPATIVDESGRFLGAVRCTGGYGEGGVFAVAGVAVNVGAGECPVPQDGPEPLEAVSIGDLVDSDALPAAPDMAAAVQDSVAAAIARWEQGIAAGQGAAGPLGPVLGDWFDEMPLMGSPVRVLLPNGSVAAEGVLVGIDGWGRITVRTDDGRELEFSGEQVFLRPR